MNALQRECLSREQRKASVKAHAVDAARAEECEAVSEVAKAA